VTQWVVVIGVSGGRSVFNEVLSTLHRDRKIVELKNTAVKICLPLCEYLQVLSDAGAKMYACKMSVDMLGLKKEDFIEGVQDIVTAGDFMDMTDGAQIVFI
jgi:peroxiredoxin family protein